jgi:hypothetical protein
VVRGSVSPIVALTLGGCALVAGLDADYVGPPDPDAASPRVDSGAFVDGSSPPPEASVDGQIDAGLDAPPADAPAFDAKPEGGPTGCAGAGYLFCDDFEGTLDAWTPGGGAGTATIDSTVACSGSKSVHMKETVNTATVNNFYETLLVHKASMPSDLYVRVFVRAAVKPVPDLTILQLTAGANGVQEEIDDGHFDGENFNFNPYKLWNGPAMRIGPCECLEIETHASTGDVNVWVDTKSVNSTNYGTVPSWDTITLGPSVKAKSTTGFTEELWFDDFAYNGSPIGCAK